MSQGVVVPQGQRRSGERGNPNTVINAIPAQLVAVEYANGQGVVVKEFWYKVGATFYQPPNAEQFAQQLRPVKTILTEQVLNKLDAQSSSVVGLPTQDDVDIVSGRVAKATESPESLPSGAVQV